MPDPAASDTSQTASLGRTSTRGVLWLTLQSIATRATGLASQLVLAWLLLPADFGLIGLANTITIVINALVSFGLDEVLLQRRQTMRSLRSSALWLSLALGLLGSAAVLIAGPLGQRAYGVPGLAQLMIPLAVALPLGAISTVPTVLLRSRLEFRFLALWGACELMLTQALTILLALLGLGAFSFALPIPFVALLRAVIFWRKAPLLSVVRPRLKQLRYLASNGSLVFGSRVITELVGQGDFITLGLFASPATVGLYYFAFRLAAQPVRMLAGNFQNVLFPALLAMRDEPRRQGAAAIKAAAVLCYLVMPVCFIQAAVAGPVVRFLFADKWAGSVPMIQVLSLGLPFDAVSWIAGALLSARGEFRRSLLYSTVTMPVFFFLAAMGALWGAGVGVAIGVSLFYFIVSTGYAWRVFTRFGVMHREVCRVYAMPVVISTITVGSAYVLSALDVFDGAFLAQLAIVVGVGGAGYAAAVGLVDQAMAIQLLDRLGLRWRRIRINRVA